MTDVIVRDSNGTQLNDGDSVTLIKDLKVKGTSTTLKRGTLVKGIRLTGNPAEVDCRGTSPCRCRRCRTRRRSES